MEADEETRNFEEEGRVLSCWVNLDRSALPRSKPKEEHRIGISSDDHDEISDRVKNWIKSIEKTKESSSSTTTTPTSSWARIPKVPHQMLRGTTSMDFKKFYEPREISIGPYHHGKPHLHSVEMIKPLCAKQFLVASGQRMEHVYKKIERNIGAVRKCYNKRPTKKYDDEKLAWMMLLDGCFILQFILSEGEIQVLREHQICFGKIDLFLLENQLPFDVLQLILESANNKASIENKIKEFVTSYIGWSAGGGGSSSSSSSSPPTQLVAPAHLLSLLRSALLGEISGEPTREKREAPYQRNNNDKWQSFRHIRELKAAGIHCKPSGTRFLRDICFESSYFCCGYLKLPLLFIDDSTKPKFLNLVAYEMCPDAPSDYSVTSYLCFIDSLIDHPDDVKELRANKILYNCLGSDEEVARIFNDISDGLVYLDVYKDVKDRIQKHYDKRVNTWIAQALHDHFSSPWTLIAFIADVLIILLTGVQTYFALPGK